MWASSADRRPRPDSLIISYTLMGIFALLPRDPASSGSPDCSGFGSGSGRAG